MDELRNQLTTFIDSSLKGYPDRLRYQTNIGTEIWNCTSRLFGIRLELQPLGSAHQFSILFSCKLPFEFKIEKAPFAVFVARLRSRPVQHHRITRIKGEETKKLLQSREIRSLIEKLHFYDTVKIREYGFTGSKMILNLEDLTEWPKTLGHTITFLRFLLNFQEVRQSESPDRTLCPYCRGIVGTEEAAVSCARCRTIHHRVCWEETDRCSVFGCTNKSEINL